MQLTTNRNSLFPTIYALTLGLTGIIALVGLTDWSALSANYLPLAFFVALSFILKRAGFHVAPQVTHSLVGIIDLAAVLIFGPILGAWVAAVSGFLYLFLNALRREKHTLRDLAEIPIFNAGLKIGMAYASTHAYTFFGGTFPPREVNVDTILPMAGAVLAWFGVDHLGWALLEFLRGGVAALVAFLRSIIFYSVLMELLPLPFALVIAVVYASAGLGIFWMMAAGLIGTAIIVQRFADASRRLEFRSNDLAALNEFGQAVSSAGFDAGRIVDQLYEHARRIVQPDLCRIELVAPSREAGTLLALEATRASVRRPNEAQSDKLLIEYFSQQREPIRSVDLARSFVHPFEATGIARTLHAQRRVQIDGSAPRSALVIPMFAGDELIGMLSMFSVRTRGFYPIHARNLASMCAQAAVGIQNARLYQSQREEAYYLNVLLQVAENLAVTTDRDEVLETIARITPLLVGVTRCALFLYHPEEKILVPGKAYGLSRELRKEFEKLRIPANNGLAFDKLVHELKPLVIEDATTSDLIELQYLRAFAVRSILMVPMIVRGEVVGAIVVDQGSRPTRFTQHEIDVVMGIANQAAAAIQAAQLTRLEYELGLARQIQLSFLPEACPNIPGYEICAWWQSALQVSGDFYDFVLLQGGRLAITIADVSDKGMAAAMFMALARTILRTMTIGKGSSREAVERANDVILADARSDMFVTVFHAILDPNEHRLTYVNGGHNPPLLYHAERDAATTLPGRGIALGVKANVLYDEHEIHFEPGDVLLMYTDGVTDAINPLEQEFGTDRLADLLGWNAKKGPAELIEEIKRAVSEFAGENVRFDDVTLIAVKRM